MQIACHECDLLIEIPALTEGSKAVCPRCSYLLTSSHQDAQDRVIAFSFSALIFLFLAFQFPFLTFSTQGLDRMVTLMQSIEVMSSENFTSLTILIFISVIVIPGLFLLCAIYVYSSFKFEKLLPYTKQLLKMIGFLKPWSMSEIFLIGILISFIKIVSLAEVELGLSFWCYVIFILCSTAAILHIDKHQAWQWFINKSSKRINQKHKSHNHLGCHVCTSVSHISSEVCDNCGAKLHHRTENSLQKSWAYLTTAAILYIPANTLPVMHTKLLGDEISSTIFGGIVLLWEQHSYPIAIIIMIASVLVPIGKIIALGWLCYSTQNRSEKSHKQKTRLYRITDFVGRWAMVDVFVVTILVALIKVGNFMNASPGWGALPFAALVILTMMAAISFDPRLIWDPVNKEKVL